MEQNLDIRNWFKLELLLHRSCSVLRQLFKRRWKQHTNTEWIPANAKGFTKERWFAECGKIQRKMIKSGDISEWDITTLGIVLRNFAINPKNENATIQLILEVRNR